MTDLLFGNIGDFSEVETAVSAGFHKVSKYLNIDLDLGRLLSVFHCP